MRLTEYGAVLEFRQQCGCCETGASKKCAEGKRLWKVYSCDNDLLFEGKIDIKEADISLGVWQKHLGA